MSPPATSTLGDRSITAYFNGDPNYNPNVMTTTETIGQANTVTTITSPSPGSSVGYGNEGNNSLNVSVDAPGVTDQSPSGSVDIFSGSPGPDTYLCTAYLGGSGNGQSNGNCYINSTTLQSGSYTLEAVYNGDNNFNGSSSTPQQFTIDEITSQMEAFPVPGYAFYGAENGNFFIVGVGGGGNGNPTGYATLTADGVSLLAPGTCSVGNGGGNPCYLDSATALPASTTPYTVTASYAGDSNFTPVSTTSQLLVLPATSTTTLAVTPSSASSNNESSGVHFRHGDLGHDGRADRLGHHRARRGARLHHRRSHAVDRERRHRHLPAAERQPATSGHLCLDGRLSRRRQYPELRLVSPVPHVVEHAPARRGTFRSRV